MEHILIPCTIFGPVKAIGREEPVIALESLDKRIVLVPIPKTAIENFITIFLEEVVAKAPLLVDFISEKLLDLEKIPGQKIEALYLYPSKDNYLYAEFIFEDTHRREFRPEDALAIAARIGCPIFVEESLLVENQIGNLPHKNEKAIKEARERQKNLPGDLSIFSLVAGWKKP